MTSHYAELGVPRARYALPNDTELSALYDGDMQAAKDAQLRIRECIDGSRALSDLKPAERELLRQDFQQQAAERRERALEIFTARVPRRFANATPDEHATAWAQKVAADPHGSRSLLLLGPTGTGKTHRAYATLRALAETGSPLPWRAFTAPDLYSHLRPHDGRSSEAEFEKVADVPMLFLDDLGAAKVTEWTEEITYRLINRRYEQCLPGIFTSNVPPPKLREYLGDRVASRLTEMCDCVAVQGADRRKRAA